MLTKTKQYLEGLTSGNLDGSLCSEICSEVTKVSQKALSADASTGPATNVDDELAHMDTAIEEAAGRIEVANSK